MPDNRVKVKKIISITAGIWFISLLVFLFCCHKTASISLMAAGIYGLWNLIIFSAAYVLITRVVNETIRQINDCIQSLIDGTPRQHFSMEEETLPGKFQMQIMKLYHIMDGAREKEEQMRRELSEIVADMIHQVNTPLTNIQMYSSFLTKDDLPPKDREQICEVIDAQIEKLGWFAEGFGKTVRMDEDMMQLNPKVQPILDMILGAIDQASLKAWEHHNELVLSGDQTIQAVYDRRWTEEAMFNLLDNAIKYGKEGCPVTVDMTAYDLFVRIDIKNWGDEIPKEEYNKIFSRFYRGQNAMFVKEGVGLGLYLVRKIVAEQGGYVKVGSYNGKGNVFSLFLRKAK